MMPPPPSVDRRTASSGAGNIQPTKLRWSNASSLPPMSPMPPSPAQPPAPSPPGAPAAAAAPMPPMPPPPPPTPDGGGGGGAAVDGWQHLQEVTRGVGAALRLASRYESKAALERVAALPFKQRQTGYVQHLVGRCHFELADYVKCVAALEAMHALEPHKPQGLELLSTALWHLKDEVKLAHLSQKVLETQRGHAEAWCVAGNCFSLHKEHEAALKFFKRAVVCDPAFTYAYTLCGHEYVANEDFDKAITMYRSAIRCDERHYNAWYGLGAIYYRQEKYDLAEYVIRAPLPFATACSAAHVLLLLPSAHVPLRLPFPPTTTTLGTISAGPWLSTRSRPCCTRTSGWSSTPTTSSLRLSSTSHGPLSSTRPTRKRGARSPPKAHFV